jgi:hypothetical protein
MYLLERGVRLTGTDAWSWDAPFSYTAAKKVAETGNKALIWEGPQGRPRHRLLPPGEAAQPGGAARPRASRSAASRTRSAAPRPAGRGLWPSSTESRVMTLPAHPPRRHRPRRRRPGHRQPADGPLPKVAEIAAVAGTVFHEVWSTQRTPAPVDNGADPTTGAALGSASEAAHASASSTFRPTPRSFLAQRRVEDAGGVRADRRRAGLDREGALATPADAPDGVGGLRHRHRRRTDAGARRRRGGATRPGSVVVQRGTNHAWANRSGRSAACYLFVDYVQDGTNGRVLKRRHRMVLSAPLNC